MASKTDREKKYDNIRALNELKEKARSMSESLPLIRAICAEYEEIKTGQFVGVGGFNETIARVILKNARQYDSTKVEWAHGVLGRVEETIPF